jgi:NADH-quinone oxidoreductase subunit C
VSDGSFSGFEAVAAGPAPSEPLENPRAAAAEPPDHPSLYALEDHFGKAILEAERTAGDQCVVYVDPSKSYEILEWLKDDASQRYDFLADVTGVDFGGGRPVQVVYQLWSNVHKRALRVKCELATDALEIRSVVSLWQTADWLEREVFDLFGVRFDGHPDLRRILMPEDYEEGYPLRKDFPLRGRFSRAEQTRRALRQDVDHYYFQAELDMGGEPMVLPGAGGEAEENVFDAPRTEIAPVTEEAPSASDEEE